MTPWVALWVWSFTILFLSFYLGRRCGWLDERARCAEIARKAGDFCRDNATRPPTDLMSSVWAARHDEARLIEGRIRNSIDLQTKDAL